MKPASTRRAPWVGLAMGVYLLVVLIIVLTTRTWGDAAWFSTVLLFGPRWIYAVPGVLLLPSAARARGFERQLSVACLAAAFGLLVWFNDITVRPSLWRMHSSEPLRLMTYNVGGGRFAQRDLIDLVAHANIDVAGIEECNALDTTAFAAAGYTALVDGGMCLVSRLPIRTIDPRDRRDFWVLNGSGDINRYEIDWRGRRFSLGVVHLETVRDGLESLRFGFWKRSWRGPQKMRENIAERVLESREALEWMQRTTLPSIVVGDFNFPTDSAIYRTFWSSFGNALSRCGHGAMATKVTRWFGIRIDHILFDAAWTCRDAWTLPGLGGDHLPVVAELIGPR